MKIMNRLTISFSCLLFAGLIAFAQNTSDAVRLSTSGAGVGARSLGLGLSNIAVADDYTAAYWNPAGLGQIKHNELSFGLSHLSYNSSASYLGNTTSFTNSATTLNDIGLVYSFPTTRGSLVLAFGYARNMNFTSGLSYKGFNRKSSMALSEDNLDTETAYQLYLVDDNNLTPFVDSLDQKGRMIEQGGINNWMISGAVEVARNVFLGATLNFVSGTYTYNRDHEEYDALNKYSVSRYDTDAVTQWSLVNTVEDEISGFTTRFGMLYKINSRAQLGFNIKIPTFYTIREDNSSIGNSEFDTYHSDGYSTYEYTTLGHIEYDVTTPFVLGAGFSFGGNEFTLSGSVEYTDWTQMQFSETDPVLEQYNTDIKEIFEATANLHVGLEFSVPETDLRLRGGFAYLPSQYKNDPTNFDQKIITGGFGILLAEVVMIDVGFAHGFYNTDHLVYEYYDNTLSKYIREITDEKITTNNLMATLSYRF